jgi:hypothetical protein
MVYIIANDNDYLQICNDKIIMIKGNIKHNDNDIEHDTIYGDKYLIKKILLGDISDNIKSCAIDTKYLNNSFGLDNQNNLSGVFKNIQKSFINNLINNNDTYTIFKNLLLKIRNGEILNGNHNELNFIHNFYENTILMDFKMIPINLKNEISRKIQNFL